MKYNPYTHIIGKVYDLTQENMNALLDEIDRLNQEYDAALMALNLKLKELHSDSLEDHQEYKRITYQLIKDLREENARYREALLKIKLMNDDPYSMSYFVASEALMGE